LIFVFGVGRRGKFTEEVDTRDELLAGILVAASHIKERGRSTEKNASFFRRNQWLHLQRFISAT
jgi:hypothetical protein